MTAATVLDLVGEVPVRDSVTLRLEETLSWLAGLVRVSDMQGDPARIDRIALLERLKAAAEAAQAVEMVRFAKSQVSEQRRLDVHPGAIGRGIADQIALSCKTSPTEGSRRLHVARDLVLDMPATLGLLAGGAIGAWTARLIASEVSHLDRPTRQRVDAELADAHLEERSPRRCAAEARRLAYRADPRGAVERCRTARSDRRVTLRPAPDTMSILSGLLPVEQGWRAWPRWRLSRRGNDWLATSGAEVRSWPTPWSSGSPDRRIPVTWPRRSRS